MNPGSPAYGLTLVILNSPVFVLFALSFAKQIPTCTISLARRTNWTEHTPPFVPALRRRTKPALEP